MTWQLYACLIQAPFSVQPCADVQPRMILPIPHLVEGCAHDVWSAANLSPRASSQSKQEHAGAGYPGDKPSGTLWQSTCTGVTILSSGTGFLSALSDCTSGGCDNIIKHTCLSSDGQSGSGMWDVNNLQHAVLTGKVGSWFSSLLQCRVGSYRRADA